MRDRVLADDAPDTRVFFWQRERFVHLRLKSWEMEYP